MLRDYKLMNFRNRYFKVANVNTHSFIQTISIAPLQRRSRRSTDTAPEFHAEAPHATESERLAQGPYVAAKAGIEHMTLRTKGVDSTKAPPRPTIVLLSFLS